MHLSPGGTGVNLHAGGDRPARADRGGRGVRRPACSRTCRRCWPSGRPSPASYLRLKPSQWAGAFTVWGRETREAALRVVTGTAGRRDQAANLEVKCVDLAANPYLALGA